MSTDDFGTLRELLSNPVQDDHWNRRFYHLLASVARLRPEEYRDVWVPYCEQHCGVLKEPVHTVFSVEDLEAFYRLMPFAPVFFYALWSKVESYFANVSEDPECFRAVSGMYVPFGGQGEKEGERVYELIANAKHLSSLRVLRLSGPSTAEAAHLLLASPHLREVRVLHMDSGRFGPEGCERFVDSAHLGQLEELYLFNNFIGDEGCRYIADSKVLKKLQVLGLRHNRIGYEGLKALANGSALRSVKRLILDDNVFGDDGCRALEGATGLVGLEEFHAEHCGIRGRGVEVLANVESLDHIRVFNIQRNSIGADGVQALAEGSSLSQVAVFNLSCNDLDDEMGSRLRGFERFRKLRTLDLSSNELGEEGCCSLANEASLSHLQELKLDYNPIGEGGYQALASSPHLSALRLLSLVDTGLTTAGCRFLTNAAHLQRLHTLDLGHNRFDDECCALFAASQAFPALRKLELIGEGYRGNGEMTDVGLRLLFSSPHLPFLVRHDLWSKHEVDDETLEELASWFGVSLDSIPADIAADEDDLWDEVLGLIDARARELESA